MKQLKTPKQMERHLKGIANHYRIEILLILAKEKKLTLETIVKRLNANQKTVSEHTRRLEHAGLITKKYQSRYVVHSLSPYGLTFVKFLEQFQSI
jgi:DNA-binding transcriptional ArsR family regulator